MGDGWRCSSDPSDATLGSDEGLKEGDFDCNTVGLLGGVTARLLLNQNIVSRTGHVAVTLHRTVVLLYIRTQIMCTCIPGTLEFLDSSC